MKKVWAVVLAVVVLAAAVVFLEPWGAKLKDYERLLNPGLSTLPDQRMLVIEAVGDPTFTSKPAFGLLFKTYFSLPEVKKGFGNMNAPRARWSVGGGIDPSKWAQVPRAQWIGRFALPVPETVASLPEGAGNSLMAASLDTWAYGSVAEILHVGSYATERPDIERLHKFIQDQGYKISGPHEEEYVKGPGMFFAGDEAKYLTIIRYQVAKAGK